MPDNRTPGEWVVRKLDRLGQLSEEDRRTLIDLPHRLEQVRGRHTLVREGVQTTECCILVSGFACRHKVTVDGARQIVSFHMRGDILDIQHLLLPRADHYLQTITPATVAWVPKADLLRLAWERPAIGAALWRDSLIDASIFREWVLNVGRRDAKSRIAHMLCEFAARCEAAGLGTADHFPLPMTQEQIGDATGLTSVHVNRMLRDLEQDGAISRTGRVALINDWARLKSIANFDSAYLHAAA
jgi:CRP-like cAMP-binding protein